MSDSTQLRAIGGAESVEEADRDAHAQLRAVLLAVVAELRRGGLDVPDHSAAQLVTTVLERTADPLRLIHKRLFFYAYQHGAIAGAGDQSEVPTRPTRISTRELAAVTPPDPKPK